MEKHQPRYVREASVTYRRTKISLPCARVIDSRALGAIAQQLIGANMAEGMLVCAFDARNKLIGYHVVGRGNVAGCPVDILAVLRYPLLCGAAAFAIAHNHPSGDVSPSREDHALTDRVLHAARTIGLPMLDHVIVTDVGDPYSFRDHGHMGEL